MRRIPPVLTCVLVVIWLLLNNSLSLAHILLGIVIAVLLMLAAAQLRPVHPRLSQLWVAVPLIVMVLIDIVRSNIGVARIVLGLVLWRGYGIGRGPGSGWMHAKLVLVVGAIGYHHVCGRLMREFEQLRNRRSARWYRVFNEVTVLLFAATVVLVVVKPF